MVSLALLNNVSYYSMFFTDMGKVTTVIYGVQKVVCSRNSPHQKVIKYRAVSLYQQKGEKKRVVESRKQDGRRSISCVSF